MAPFRLPEKHLAMFKALCNATAQHLPNKGSVPLLGRKLYNRFSEALGHKDFNALQQDARQYGNGRFVWHEFVERLTTRLHQSLGTGLDPTVAALGSGCSEIAHKYAVVSDIAVLEAYGGTGRVGAMYQQAEFSERNELEPRRPIDSSPFKARSDDLDFLDEIHKTNRPIIDLHPVRAIKHGKDKINVLMMIAQQFVDMTKEQQERAVFLGDKQDVAQLLQADPSKAHKLLQNPSIQVHNIKFTCAKIDISSLGGKSDAEVSAIMSNVNSTMLIQVNSQLSIGEAFAGRQTPLELASIKTEIESFIGVVKAEVPHTMPGSYDLQKFANHLYGKLSTTNGFSSLDLAGFLLDNGCKLRVAFVY